MKKRIKYFQKELDHIIKSEPIWCINNDYIAHINKETFIWVISNNNGIISEGRANSVISAKKEIKEEFKKLGAIFFQEVRKKDII